MAMKVLIDGKHKSVGNVEEIIALAASDRGIWLFARKWKQRVLYSADGLRFQSIRAPEDVAGHGGGFAILPGETLLFGSHGLARSVEQRPFQHVAKAELRKGVRSPDIWSVRPGAPGELWVASTDRVLHSVDNGVHWRSIPAKVGELWGIVPFASGAIAVGEAGIFRIDGKTSKRVLARQNVRNIAMSPAGILLAVGDNGFVVSSRDGKRWKRLGGGKGMLVAVAWCHDRFVLGGERGRLFTTDGTKALSSVKSGLSGEDGWISSIAPFRSGYLAAGTADFGIGALLWSGGDLKAAPAPTRVADTAPVAVPAPVSRKPRKTQAFPDGTKVEWKAVSKTYRPITRAVVDAGELDEVLLLQGSIAADKLPAWSSSKNKRAVVIDGDLWLAGDASLHADQDYDTELAIFVTGNVSARSLVLGPDVQLFIGGDLEVEEVIACGDGSWGRLDVGGRIRARATIVSGDAALRAGKGVEGLWLNCTNEGNVEGKGFPTPTPAEEVLSTSVLDGDSIEIGKVRKALAAKKPVLR